MDYKMEYRTSNYTELESQIKTKREAFKLSVVTFEPSVIIDRVDDLMRNFSELYLESKESLENLQNDIENRPGMVTSLFFSIWTHIQDVSKMLKECQDFDPKKQTLEC